VTLLNQIQQADSALYDRITQIFTTGTALALEATRGQTVARGSTTWDRSDEARIGIAEVLAKDSGFKRFCDSHGYADLASRFIAADRVIGELFPI